MKFDVFSIFPELFKSYLETSMLHKAAEKGLISVDLHNIRDYATDKHHMTDDTPFGGGGGMVMKPEPIFNAIESVLGNPSPVKLILLTPQGKLFNQKMAEDLGREGHLALLCGRYEGVDERVREHLVTEEISIGDYVLTGGELPALILIDALARLVPGVLGDPQGAAQDSHATGLLEHPHYTRPNEYRSWEVPAILRSGDHGKIEQWRREQSLLRTYQRRPDLLAQAPLTKADIKYLSQLERAEKEN